MSSASSGNASSNLIPAGVEDGMDNIDEDQAMKLGESNIAMDIDLSSSPSTSGSEKPSEHCYHKRRKLTKEIDSKNEIDPNFDSLISKRCAEVMNKLQEDRENGILCDIVLNVDGERFHAHKGVLKAGSPYFEAMFTSKFSERDKDLIEIKGVTKDVFGHVLDYAYGQKMNFNFEYYESIFKAAEMFLMQSLMEECQQKIQLHFKTYLGNFSKDPFNKVSVEKFSRFYRVVKRLNLEDTAKSLIVAFRKKASETDSQDALLAMSPVLLLDYIKQEKKFDVAGQTNTLKFLAMYFSVVHQPQDRLNYLEDFIASINFSQVSLKACRDFENKILDLAKQFPLVVDESVTKNSFDAVIPNSIGFSHVIPWKVYILRQSHSGSITINVCDNIVNAWESRTFQLGSTVKIRHMIKVGNFLVLLNKSNFFTIQIDNWQFVNHSAALKGAFGDFHKVFLACSHGDRMFVTGDQMSNRIFIPEDTAKDACPATYFVIYEVKGFETGKLEARAFKEVCDVESPQRHPLVNKHTALIWDVRATMVATKSDIYVVTVPRYPGRSNMAYPYESTEVVRKYRLIEDNSVIMEAYDFSASYLYGSLKNNPMFSTINSDEEDPEKCLHVYGPFNPSRALLDGVHFDTKTMSNKPFRRMKRFMLNPDGIKDVEGSMHAVCSTSRGDLILAAQKGYLVLFLLKELANFKPVSVLPEIEINTKDNFLYLLES